MNRVVLLTGGNIGNIEANIASVPADIEREIGRIALRSRVYKSASWGFAAAEPFYNQVLVCETLLTPRQVLDKIHEIEARYGRIHACGQLYASRTMDIDILFYNDEIILTDTLTVPHPLLHRREFVLNPLCEIMGGYVHPILGKSLDKFREELKTQI